MAGERRYERRIEIDDEVDVHCRDAAGADTRMIARLRDLSRSGACLEVPRPIRMATLIDFAHGGREFKASVRYCKKEQNAFLIGVEFEDSLA